MHFIIRFMALVAISVLSFINSPSVQAQGILDHINIPDKSVILTFEDIQDEISLVKTLDILNQNNIKALFFLSGEFITSKTSLVNRVVQEGHRLGNIGYKREYWGEYTAEQIHQSLLAAEKVITDITNTPSQYIRPAFNYYSDKYYSVAAKFSDKTILRGFNVFDWTKPNREAVLAALNDIKSGDIVNINISHKASLNFLPDIIAKLKTQFSFYLPETVIIQRKKCVSFTFDDGGSRANVIRILEVLKKHYMPATFFLVGEWIENNSDLVKLMSQEEYEVANHSYSHPRFSTLSREAIAKEISATEKVYKSITGKDMKPLFRPPYGDYNDNVKQVLKQMNYKETVMWNVDTRDWSGKSAEEISNIIFENINAGSIVLFHLHGAHTAEALERVIPPLKAQGFEFVKISELFG